MLGFVVDSISPDGLVLGRNLDLDIPVGTRFTAVRRSRIDRSTRDLRTSDLGEAAAVGLTLLEVRWYGRTIEYVPAGHTAGLVVVGDGLEILVDLLRSSPVHDYLVLAAREP